MIREPIKQPVKAEIRKQENGSLEVKSLFHFNSLLNCKWNHFDTRERLEALLKWIESALVTTEHSVRVEEDRLGSMGNCTIEVHDVWMDAKYPGQYLPCLIL